MAVSGVRYPRVTNPFAAIPPEKILMGPHDLHALSTPPAFILDQDQILKRKSLIGATLRNSLYSALKNQK
jgi:hypothetical protein